MIVQHTTDGSQVLFVPEDLKERKKMEAFPGMLRQGLQFFCPNKPHVVYNLYQRLKKRFKTIKYTPAIKEMVEGDIVIKELPAHFKFHTSPLKHQIIALRFAYTFGSFMNLSEPGLGKTKVTLDYIWLMQFRKSLIVCPKSLLFVWEEEVVKHRPELSLYVVKSTDWDKELDRVSRADIVVINYDKAVSLQEALKGLKFDFIAVDEGLIKNPSTERTKALTELSRGIPYRSVMSGTLVNNSPLDVFAPLRFVEPSLVGSSFSKFRDEYAVASFKNRFITIGYKNIPEVKEMLACCSVIMTKAEWLKDLPPKKFIHKYVQMGDMQRDYYQRLASNYLLQIPEEGIEIEVDNPLSTMAKLNQISNGFVYYKEDIEETLNELYGTESKKRSKINRKAFIFKEQPKAQALIDLIRSDEFNGSSTPVMVRKAESEGSEYHGGDVGSGSISVLLSGELGRHPAEKSNETIRMGDDSELRPDPSGSKLHLPKNKRAIIWFNLSAELDILRQHLRDAGVSFLVISGGTKDIGGIVREFNSNPSIQFLLCQAKTINYGVTIMGTKEEDLDDFVFPEFDPQISDEIFYSLNFSLEIFLQQQDRIHRIGQTRECRYWIILTNSKVERHVASRLEDKLVCNKEILVDLIFHLDKDLLEV